MSKPQISVIACHHVGDLVYKFVESVKKSTGVTYEIIIMTSDEKLAATGIPHCWVHYHEGMPAAKRNAGVRVAKADYVAFFDDDVEIDERCLYYLYHSLYQHQPGMSYGKLHKADEPTRFDEAGGYLTATGFIWSRAGQNIVDTGQYDSYDPILAGKSASCIINKSLFNKVGGFDEDFEILGEETDLSWRVWLAGYKVRFCPMAVGIHYFNTIYKPAKLYYTSKRVNYNGCRNYIVMLFKNLETHNLWKILPIHILIWFGASFAMLITMKLESGWNILKGIAYVIRHIGLLLEKRKFVQERRKVSDEELFKSIFKTTPRGYYMERFKRYVSIGLHG